MGLNNSKPSLRDCNDDLYSKSMYMVNGGAEKIRTHDLNGSLEEYEKQFRKCLKLYCKEMIYYQIESFKDSIKLIENYKNLK